MEVSHGSFTSFKNELRVKISDKTKQFEFVGDVNEVYRNVLYIISEFTDTTVEFENVTVPEEEIKRDMKPIKETKTNARIIEVHKNCVISQTERYPDRNLLVAVDVMALDDTQDGFINLTIGVDDYRNCCEDFNVSLSIEEEIEKHVVEIVILNSAKEDRYYEQESIEFYIVCYDGEVIHGSAYNHHNGYYGHWVGYVLNNGEQELQYDEI